MMDEIAEQSRASIEKEDLKILLPIVARIEPKVILEIGMHQGYSMEVWRKAFPNANLVGIEIEAPTENSYRENAMLWNTDSHNPPPSVLQTKNIDFLFIDGGHSFEGVKQDFEMYSPLVRKGGIIVFHDVVYTSSDPLSPVMVKPLWDGLKLKYPYIEIKSKNSTGMGILYV